MSSLLVAEVMLKALRLLHSASLHRWLLDVQQNLGGSGAIGAIGAGAAGAGGPVPPKNNDPDPCAAEKRAVLLDSGTVDKYKGQIAYYTNGINNLAGPANQLVNRAYSLAAAAQSEVADQFALTAITQLIQLVANASGFGAAATVVGLATDPVGTVAGNVPGYTEVQNAKFLAQMNQYFQASQGDLNALAQLCKANPLPDAQQFLEAMQALQNLVAQGDLLVKAQTEAQNNLTQAQDQLAKDQQDLDACLASHAGDSSSGGDS
jgi:cytochrome c556